MALLQKAEKFWTKHTRDIYRYTQDVGATWQTQHTHVWFRMVTPWFFDFKPLFIKWQKKKLIYPWELKPMIALKSERKKKKEIETILLFKSFYGMHCFSFDITIRCTSKWLVMVKLKYVTYSTIKSSGCKGTVAPIEFCPKQCLPGPWARLKFGVSSVKMVGDACELMPWGLIGPLQGTW